jgi:hypothetical protein
MKRAFLPQEVIIAPRRAGIRGRFTGIRGQGSGVRGQQIKPGARDKGRDQRQRSGISLQGPGSGGRIETRSQKTRVRIEIRSQKTEVRTQEESQTKEQNSDGKPRTTREKTGGRRPGGRDKGRGRGSVHSDQGACKKDEKDKLQRVPLSNCGSSKTFRVGGRRRSLSSFRAAEGIIPTN